MNELRWILIVLGIALLAGIYLWGRRRAAPEEDSAPARPQPEPSLGGRAVAEPKYEAPQYAVPEYPEDETPYLADRYEPAEHELAPEEDWPEPQLQSVTTGRHAHAQTLRDAPVDRFDADRFDEALDEVPAQQAAAADLPDYRRSRREPTLGEFSATPQPHPRPVAPQREPAPKEEPAARRSDKRKILALRLSLAPQGVEGGRLLEAFQEELLEHGRYDIFHRHHEDGEAVFSIASMIEPGTFDPEQMGEVMYPGVMLFAQLPAPVAGMHALNEMVSCARRLQQGLGGILQDDRGVTLTEHRVERMREEVREFERPPGVRLTPGSGAAH